ncbi:hypothetical protein CBR_g4847 [Chara braunii]|uniref:Uncharacterized protein n=1 Tax=Chara braunii TaxID=69332 RepID=A0A388KIZ0_CHABU|nr:hypothetical protein CBR_g4847 [Chara braunii]|eukprot:GBG70020.1 hypothetical protein CBR_g4847 [Chara braunii]
MYKMVFKLWMTKAEFRELRRQEDESVFWVIALQIPLDVMPFIYAQIEKAIGKIVSAHPTDADPLRPALVNAKFDLVPESRANMKDVLWIETSNGDTLEVRLASSGTPKCKNCRQFFHTEEECRRGPKSRNQGTTARATTSLSQAQGLQHQPTASSRSAALPQGSYRGPMGPRPLTQMPLPGGLQGGAMRSNPTFSPGPGGAGQSGLMGVPTSGSLQHLGGGGGSAPPFVTPGSKTTRDRRLAAAARPQGTEMPQYLLPLLCTAVRNALWVISWQKGPGPLNLFAQAVSDLPSLGTIEECIRTLYLGAVPARVISDIPMPRVLFGLTDGKVKFYIPIIDARLTEEKVSELEALDLRLIPMTLFADCKKQELSRLVISLLMITADAIAELKIRSTEKFSRIK